ncbi:hypothetical protein [Streptomyces rapamycinicus]|uniref:hypothetical protein n=1 Tax=Streptomyces rapamycinicus TaxID=1226757 RepID=UPI0032D94CD5
MPESQTPAAPSTPAADPAATPSTPPAAPTPPVAPPPHPRPLRRRPSTRPRSSAPPPRSRPRSKPRLSATSCSPPAPCPRPERRRAEQDPAALAAQATTERDQAQAEVRRLRVELAAHQAAHGAGADPARLLDSRAVERQLSDLDPDDAKFGDKLAAVITAAVEASPHLRAEGTPAGPPKGGADFTPGSTPTPTADQFARMSYGERVELHQSDPDLYARLSAASE